MGIGAALGGIGGALFGGPVGAGIGSALGGAIDSNETENEAARQKNLEYERQKEFAKHGIQWRVEDARAAGLHPLSVLGSSGAGYGSQAVTIGADSGQDYSGAVLAASDPHTRNKQQEELALLRASRARTEAETIEIYDRISRGHQERNARPGMPGIGSDVVLGASKAGVLERSPLASDAVKISPSSITSHTPGDKSAAAGVDVAWKPYYLWPGRPPVYAPNASNFGEAMESLSESGIMMDQFLGVNIARNPQFMADWADHSATVQGYRGVYGAAGLDQYFAPEDARLQFGPGKFGRPRGATRGGVDSVLRRYPHLYR